MFHIKIKILRENRGLTQKQLADLLYIDRSTYSYYESSRILPSVPIIIRLSKLYSVSCDYLIKNGKECDNMDDLLNEVCKKERELLCYFRMIPTYIQDEIIDVIKNWGKEVLKMENKDYFLNHVKKELEEAFRLYYDLTFGFYDLEKTQELKIRELSKVIKSEVYKKGGKFYKLFEKIGKVEDEIYTLEDKAKKDDKNFDIDEGLSAQIRDLYDDAIKQISKLMFMYGVQYGKNLEKCLNDVPYNFCKEVINGRY